MGSPMRAWRFAVLALLGLSATAAAQPARVVTLWASGRIARFDAQHNMVGELGHGLPTPGVVTARGTVARHGPPDESGADRPAVRPGHGGGESC